MSKQNQILDICRCCEGVKLLTPKLVENLPGLAAIAYRVGTHGSFKKTMQALLLNYPALEALTTRDDDDPSIALLDAWATVLDVLTFYQERIVNEGYLRTAKERRSVLELANHISYMLRPGVAASTYLAFKMDETPGAPSEAKIYTGTKVQSVPKQDELPQVFETIEEISAKTEWNELKPSLKKKEIPGFGAKEIYLKGILTGLRPGDGILMIGAEREEDKESERWDFRRVKEVFTDAKADFTKVTWDEGLGWQMFSRKIIPAQKDFQIFAFRQQAFLFGYNAPDWRGLSDEIRTRYLNGEENDSKTNHDHEWPTALFNIAAISGTPNGEEIKTIFLNSLYPQIVKGSWLVLVTPEPEFYVEVYEVLEAVESSRKGFTLTAKTTAVTLKGENLRKKFNKSVRETVIFAQSEELEMAEKPITDSIEGREIILRKYIADLSAGQTIIISGKRIRAQIVESTQNLKLWSLDETEFRSLKLNDSLIVTKTPEIESDGKITWTLMDNTGFIGTIRRSTKNVNIIPAEKRDNVVSEIHTIDKVESGSDLTTIFLENVLTNSFDRATVTFNANVAKATHGETKKEILGSGDGSQVFQKFELKQKPLTYVSAATTSGTETTLEIRVNDILWKEVPTFYGMTPEERVYIIRISDDGKVTVQFGDGITGARLPTGTENVKATYRIGTGFDGLLDADQLSLLMTPQLGVKGVTNPLAPTGADNPETLDNARCNAPLNVLTLDRIVSLQDFEDFTRAFAGIGKARADLLWNGEQRIVHITVASADGKRVDKTSDLYEKLSNAINLARHSNYHVRINSFLSLNFNVKARVLINEDFIVENVLDSIFKTLTTSFSFDIREFGQDVTPSEVMSVIQKVKGVVAVDLEELGGQDPFSQEHFRLKSEIARWDGEDIIAAELLTINPNGIDIKEMQ